MKTSLLILSVCIAVFCNIVLMDRVEAKEVTLQYKDLTLNANLELSAGGKIEDGIILITHGGLAHSGMEIIAYLQSLFKERGYNTLAITLALGINNRHGMYDCKATHKHRHEDAVDEIGAWLDWLNKQGTQQVTLLGHSRGGAQVALYLSERNTALVKNAVLMAPATRLNGAAGYEQRYKQPLAPTLNKAKSLVASGKGDTLIEHTNLLYCRDTKLTAATFVSYYAQDQRLDTPSLLTKSTIPALVIIAGSDQVVINLDKRLTTLVNRKHLRIETINGSDHFFRDLNSDDAVDIIDEFLQNSSN